jgi:uncharacterized protein (TIGR03067 family)
MQWRLLLGLALGLLTVADGFGVPDWPAKKRKVPSDSDQIQGTWTATSWESNGAKIQGNLRVVVRKDRWVLTVNGDIIKGTLKLDPTRKVKAFDATVTDGAGKGMTVLGIYRLAGNTWTACWILPFDGQARPQEFANTANAHSILFVLQRAKR